MSNRKNTIVYKRYAILISGTYDERFVVEVGGEWFHFPTLEKAKEWIDFINGAVVGYSSNLTC